MEKRKIMNIATNLSLVKENYQNYVKIKDNDNFDFQIKKKNLYNNWIITLCDLYNSLLKYYKNDINEYWGKIKLFVTKTYKYEDVEFTLHELIKKYRNKKVHSANPDSVENNLLPIIVSDTELEELQKMLIDVINYELKKIDMFQLATHALKSGTNIIVYKKFINSLNDSMMNATEEEMEILMIPYSILQNVINILTDDSLLTKEVFDKLEKDLEIANNIINSDKFTELILEQPNGKDILDFVEEIKNANNERDLYNICMAFKNKILSNK